MIENIAVSLFFAVVSVFATHVAQAESSEDVKDAINAIVLMCVAGGEKYEISGGADLSGGLALRRLGVSGGADIKISKSEAKGLVDGLSQSLTKIAADQASEARRCMQPYLQRIVDLMIGLGLLSRPFPLHRARQTTHFNAQHYYLLAQVIAATSIEDKIGRINLNYRNQQELGCR